MNILWLLRHICYLVALMTCSFCCVLLLCHGYLAIIDMSALLYVPDRGCLGGLYDV